ncbi:MAG: hypothetical protein ACREJO_06875 [Phycisphaerales bacterium]
MSVTGQVHAFGALGASFVLAGLAPALVWAQPQVTQPLDQAAAKLDALSADAADTSALFGIPTQEQAKRVSENAKAAIQLLDQAERAIRTQLERARVAVPATNEERARIKRLREVELALRVPILRGRAAALAAMIETDGDQKSLYLAMANGALSAADGLPTAAEGIRRVTLAAVIVGRNQGGRGGETSKKAIDLVRSVLELPVGADPATSISALTRFEAIVALCQCVDSPAEARRITEKASAEATEPLLRVVCIEALARAMRRLGAGSIDPRATGIDTPADVLASLATRTDLGLTPEQAEVLVFEKLAGAYRDEPRNSDDLVLVARGVVLCRAEGSRSSGLALLDKVATGIGPSELRADAAWYAAAFRWQSDRFMDKLQTVDSLLTLARRAPNSKRADDAVRLAVQRGRELAAMPGQSGPGTKALTDALGVAIERFRKGPDADLYRIELAQTTPVREAADLSRVLDALRAVPANSTHAARAAQLLRARVDAHLAEVRDAANKPNADPKQCAKALTQSLSLALTVLQNYPAAGKDQAALDELMVELAEAKIAAGEKDAEELFKELISSGAAERIRGGQARLSLGLARAYRTAGREEAAFNALKAFVEPMDAPDTVAVRPPEYWLAWAEMLEMIFKKAKTTEHGDIRLKIRTLQALDPKLGGDEAFARITAVEKALK